MYTSGSPGVSEPPVTSPTSSEWSYSSNSALRRQRRYESVPAIRATPSSHSQSTPANLSSPFPAKTCASGSCSAVRTCTPNVSPSTSARWQRELWSTDTSTDGGDALKAEIGRRHPHASRPSDGGPRGSPGDPRTIPRDGAPDPFGTRRGGARDDVACERAPHRLLAQESRYRCRRVPRLRGRGGRWGGGGRPPPGSGGRAGAGG